MGRLLRVRKHKYQVVKGFRFLVEAKCIVKTAAMAHGARKKQMNIEYFIL